MADPKQEENTKQGIEYLIEQGYKKISTKTFISDVELEHFLNKDFSNINKTRALGFIQILEREYPVDLSELKNDYLEYELSHKRAEPKTLFVEQPMKSDKAWLAFWPYILIGLALLGLLFLFLTGNESAKIEPTVEPIKKHIEENNSVIKQAEENIAKLEENKSTQINKPSMTTVSDNTTVQNLDLDLDKVVLQMIQERNLSVEEHNITLEDTKESVETAEELLPIQETEVVAQAVPSVEEKVVKKQEPKKEVVRGDLYIKPTRKTWVGVIYLDDFTKKDFLIRKKLPLNAKRDQLIVIGHKHFNLYNKNYSIKFRGKGPVRFIYKDGEVMEINKKEFDKTSAGVAW
ncbi:MAG: hypothetical protein K0U47_00435 [Epsilonproteobacteria bacterium]|nr:hypothetical protein [Campylobacterota bacterium]